MTTTPNQPTPTDPEQTQASKRNPARLTTRTERLNHPTSLHALRELAAKHGVCSRLQPVRRTDLATGQTEWFDVPCNATQDKKCPACAKRAKRLRQVQARQGWHATEEPHPEPEANPEQLALLELRATYEYLRADCLAKAQWDQVAELDDAIAEVERGTRASGLRGRVTPPADHTAAIAANRAHAEQITASIDPAHKTGADETSPAQPDGAGQGSEPESTQDGPGESTQDSSAGSDSSSSGRRVRSTRRRQDVPDLPRQKVEARTIGRTFNAQDGKVFRPSMFVTITLPSYGRVREDGSPVDPTSYDYRRAAWDAVHLPALLDRFWQNLRRALGWNVQYFGSVEPQRRLAPHAHFAIRGAIPRAVIRDVLAATYFQVWWPSTATIVYGEQDTPPVWDQDGGVFRDPYTGRALTTWDEALDELDQQLDADPDQGAEHVARFGDQANLQGVLAGTAQADKLIGYLSKYLTKSVADCHHIDTPTAAEHQRRLWEELRYTPCSPRCPNWLRYGIQPEGAKDGMRAGFCRGKVHQLDTLGLGGRRVLVSRLWSGKTLADHRYDQQLWLRNLLQVARGIDDDIDPNTADHIAAARAGGAPAPIAWERCRPGDPDVPDLARRILRAIAAKIKHREAIAAAKAPAPPIMGEGRTDA
jgi:hypothetical protein